MAMTGTSTTDAGGRHWESPRLNSVADRSQIQELDSGTRIRSIQIRMEDIIERVLLGHQLLKKWINPVDFPSFILEMKSVGWNPVFVSSSHLSTPLCFYLWLLHGAQDVAVLLVRVGSLMKRFSGPQPCQYLKTSVLSPLEVDTVWENMLWTSEGAVTKKRLSCQITEES